MKKDFSYVKTNWELLKSTYWHTYFVWIFRASNFPKNILVFHSEEDNVLLFQVKGIIINWRIYVHVYSWMDICTFSVYQQNVWIIFISFDSIKKYVDGEWANLVDCRVKSYRYMRSTTWPKMHSSHVNMLACSYCAADDRERNLVCSRPVIVAH